MGVRAPYIQLFNDMDALFERFYMSMSPFETLELLKRPNWMKEKKEVVNKVDSELVRNPVEILLS